MMLRRLYKEAKAADAEDGAQAPDDGLSTSVPQAKAFGSGHGATCQCDSCEYDYERGMWNSLHEIEALEIRERAGMDRASSGAGPVVIRQA